MNAELLDRRETLLRFMVKGSKLCDVVEEMTKDIGDPSERQKQVAVIRRDWNNRGRWMDNVVRVSDGSFLTELVAGMDEAMKRCWVEYAKGIMPLRVWVLYERLSWERLGLACC